MASTPPSTYPGTAATRVRRPPPAAWRSSPASTMLKPHHAAILLSSSHTTQESLMRLVSPPISTHEGRLPRQYTMEGQGAKKDISPPLEWYGLPDGTRSLALVVQDIDAPDPESPVVPWTHWVVVNISPSTKGLPEGFSGSAAGRDLGGVHEGINDWKQPGWNGPVPSSHGHRIQFKLYALDDELHLGNKVTVDKVMEAIEGRVLAEAKLTAIF